MERTFIINNYSNKKKIIFHIKGNYKIIFESKRITAIGNFASFYINQKIYDIEKIEKLLNSYNLSTLISNSIGKFVIFDNYKKKIYLSLSF